MNNFLQPEERRFSAHCHVCTAPCDHGDSETGVQRLMRSGLGSVAPPSVLPDISPARGEIGQSPSAQLLISPLRAGQSHMAIANGEG
jgi:hypothetical protein